MRGKGRENVLGLPSLTGCQGRAWLWPEQAARLPLLGRGRLGPELEPVGPSRGCRAWSGEGQPVAGNCGKKRKTSGLAVAAWFDGRSQISEHLLAGNVRVW